jgi:nitrogen fixation/metabolism regulation signal transduction histidine kinase
MKNRFRMGGFEKRLVVAFLLLSVAPTLLIAFFSTRYFMRSVALVSNPAVEQSFSNSMVIARNLAARLEQDAGCTSKRLREEMAGGSGRAATNDGARPPGGMPADNTAALLEKVSRETHADFAAVYTLEGSAWKLKASFPAEFARIDSELDRDAVRAGTSGAAADSAGSADSGNVAGTGIAGSAEPVRIAFSDPDVIASGVTRGTSLYASGFALDAGFTEMMRRTGDDLGRYHAVALYVSVLRRYIIIVTSVIVAILIISSALVSRLLARRISQPITELAHATERIASGDLDHRVMVQARDEIASLVTDFNKMTEELLENKRNLIRAERIAAWRDVARRIAHEIKNPLTPIEIAIYRIKKRLDAGRAGEEADGETGAQAGADAGAEGAAGTGVGASAGADAGAATPGAAAAARDRAVIEESLDSILKEVAALKTIAQEFSAFAKMPEPRFEVLSVNDIVRSVIELYASSFPRVEVRAHIAEALPPVAADKDQLRSVVSNLVKNAFEAMPAGGTLTLATSLAAPDKPTQPAWVRIEIGDTGEGIPDEIKDKIFDPYFTTKSTGSGIGLALAYRILSDHHGKISFRTGNTGTTFIVDLPVAKA